MGAMELAPAALAALEQARRQITGGQLAAAEAGLRALVAEHTGCTEAWLMLAGLARRRGDDSGELACLQAVMALEPADQALGLDVAQLQLKAGNTGDAIRLLCGLLERTPANYPAWFVLGDALALAGRREDAVRARFQGLRQGQSKGHLMGMSSTPPPLQPVIRQIIASVNDVHGKIIAGGLARMRERFGHAEMKRLEHAIAAYQGFVEDRPASPHQKPKFLFFPGLPQGPYHDPYLHPWTRSLVDAYDDIRAEAIGVLQDRPGMESFLTFQPGQSKDNYLGGDGGNPSWDAYFFYRHGKRYDDNHAGCPKTSALLDAVELCQVDGQAPEICFSVLQPGTHIKLHYGVTNTRLVLHLPLIVPDDCALNVMGGGEHAWREREPMMFDDTFQHEAWNRSDKVRVILLMDCWNPHLSAAERVATRHLVELIGAFENFTAQELAQLPALLG